MNETIKLLKSHTSIRKYTNQQIPEDVLKEIIFCGQSAATSSYIQAATIVRVKDESKKQAIYEIAGKQPQILGAGEFLMVCGDLRRSQKCCDLHNKQAQIGFSEHFIIATTDASLFAQNMVIAAESLGLGICYIGGIRNNPQVVCDVLNLPDYVYPVFGLCLGYPDEKPQVKPRLPQSVVVKQDGYDSGQDEDEIKKYDEVVKNYYSTRDTNTKVSGWSEQMSGLLSKESRPHIKDFLTKRGFLQR